MLSLHERRTRELQRLRNLSPLEEDPYKAELGVIYSSLIIKYSNSVSKNQSLISPFEENRLHPAGYKLTVGNEFYLEGKFYRLPSYPEALPEERRSCVEIPPFQVAVPKTAETMCLPRFLIGRWNIVVKMAYKGLLWVGGAQVDPGYVGHLFCPIYNLSSKTVTLNERDEIALIDFVKTSPFPYLNEERADKWIRQPLTDKPLLEDYVADLRSALFTEAGERVKTIQYSVKSLEHRFIINTQFTLAALAVIPAILATMLPFPGTGTVTSSIWGPIAIGFSTFAFVSAFLRWRSNGRQRSSNAVWYAGAVAVVLAAIASYFTYTFNVRYVERIATWRFSEEMVGAEFQRIRDDISKLRGDLRLESREAQSALEELESRVDELESEAVQPEPDQSEGGPVQ